MTLAGASSIAGAVWRHRYLVAATVAREYQQRYHGSILGFLWPLLQPLGTVLIFTLIFGNIMRARLPGMDDSLGYGIYLCSGLFAWTMFSEIIQRGLTMFIDFGNLLKKSNFPHSAVPLIVAGSALVNFAIAFAIFLVFLVAVGRFPGVAVLASIPVVLLFVVIATSLALLLGTLHVFLRDTGQAITILLQFWFWLTPVVYVMAAVPDSIARRLAYNPVAPLIQAMHDIFVAGVTPRWYTLAVPAGVAIVLALLSIATYRAYKHDLVDEL